MFVEFGMMLRGVFVEFGGMLGGVCRVRGDVGGCL